MKFTLEINKADGNNCDSCPLTEHFYSIVRCYVTKQTLQNNPSVNTNISTPPSCPLVPVKSCDTCKHDGACSGDCNYENAYQA
jgi:hypothetical protein